jgi:hypothetical protein
MKKVGIVSLHAVFFTNESKIPSKLKNKIFQMGRGCDKSGK